MQVKFATTFAKSLKKLHWHNTRTYKIYSFFRYDIKRFVKNVWLFRKALANYYWWDHHGTLEFMRIGLTQTADGLEKWGMEIELPRGKKVAAIRRATELINNYNKDLYIEMAEAELGEITCRPFEFKPSDKEGYFELVDNDTPEESAHKKKVFARAREIEELEWKELWRTLQGQDHSEYKELSEALTEEDRKKNEDLYYQWFDGTGMNGWWD